MGTMSHVRFLAAFVIGAVTSCSRPPAAGDRENSTAAPDHPPTTAVAPSATAVQGNLQGLSCSLRVAKSAGNRHAVSLQVSNAGSNPVELRYYHPATFALRAWIDGQPIPPRVPAIDMPVEPRTVRVEPGATIDVTTPVALSFGPGSRELDQSDPFRWWLDHAPARVRLEASRVFESEPLLLCAGVFAP